MPMATVKRVISNPEELGRYNAKMSKQSFQAMATCRGDHQITFGAITSTDTNADANLIAGLDTGTTSILTPAMDALVIVGPNDKVEEETKLTSVGSAKISSDSDNQDKSNKLTKSSTDNLDENLITNGEKFNLEKDLNASQNLKLPMVIERKEEGGKADNFPRQVSVDSSTAPNSDAPLKVVEFNRTSSMASSNRNKSASTVESFAGNVARDWGWFEDIHDHSSKGNNKSPSDEKKSSGKKKGGHLFFDDFSKAPPNDNDIVPKKNSNKIDHYGNEDGTMMAVTAPTYVLEESISSQKLWKDTAGTRPPQPVDERAFYEKIWAQNFKRSQVDYQIPADVLTATSPISLSPFADGNFGAVEQSLAIPNDFIGPDSEHAGTTLVPDSAAASSLAGKSVGPTGFYGIARAKNRKEALMGPHNHHHTLVNKKVKEDGTDDELTVMVRGDNVFGTTVSKSFARDGTCIDTVSISIASYRVVESKKHGKYAQFLVIFCDGTFRDTIGVWKRYSDFEKLSRIVSHGNESCSSVLAGIHPLAITEDQHQEMLPNAITSWNLLKKRKRWYRCLDAGYLSLKAFLLERFLHDILFESSTPEILRDFVATTLKV